MERRKLLIPVFMWENWGAALGTPHTFPKGAQEGGAVEDTGALGDPWVEFYLFETRQDFK